LVAGSFRCFTKRTQGRFSQSTQRMRKERNEEKAGGLPASFRISRDLKKLSQFREVGRFDSGAGYKTNPRRSTQPDETSPHAESCGSPQGPVPARGRWAGLSGGMCAPPLFRMSMSREALPPKTFRPERRVSCCTSVSGGQLLAVGLGRRTLIAKLADRALARGISTLMLAAVAEGAEKVSTRHAGVRAPRASGDFQSHWKSVAPRPRAYSVQ